jgi:hypothetical protein
MALGQATLVASEAVSLLLQQTWAEMDYRFEVCYKGQTNTVLMMHENNLDIFSLRLVVACYNPYSHSSAPNLRIVSRQYV